MAEFLDLRTAIAQFVRPGATIALEGFTHLIPFAAAHEIIRQEIRDLTLIRMTPDLIYDQMIGSGCASKLIFSWGGNPGVGSLHRLRDAVEHGWPRPLVLEEHSHAGMAHAYAAGAAGMPCAFLRGYRGTDLPRVNSNIRFVTCPFTSESLACVPAIRPDVAIVHAQKADRDGNVLIEGIMGVQKEAGTGGTPLDRDRRRSGPGVPRGGGTGAHPAVVERRDDRGRGGWRATLICARLLRARQCVLRRVGCHRQGPRHLPGVDQPARPSARGAPRMTFTPSEMMTVAAARALTNDDVCFVGIGLPSAACNLARLTHAPRLKLIYESGTIEAKPTVLPLSIGDGELCETALTTVSVAEVFQVLAAGRAHHGWIPRRGSDRPIREPEHHRDR